MRVTRCIGFAASVFGAGLVIGAEPQGGAGAPGANAPPGPQPEGRRNDERRGRMFDEMDTNKDGQVSREEFAARRSFRGDGQRRGPGNRGPGGGPGGADGGNQPGGPLGGPRGEGPGQGGENRRGGPPMFGMLDSNRDGKLQTAEIQRAIDAFKKALEASREEDLTAEDWRDVVDELRPAGDRPPGQPGGPGGAGQAPPPPPK